MSRRAATVCLAVVAAATASRATSAQPAGGLSGSYRTTLRTADLVRAGAPLGAVDDVGTWTLTFAGTRWTLRQAHAPDQDAVDRGVFVVTGDQVELTLLTSDRAAHRLVVGTFTWRVSSRTLRLSLRAHQFPTSIVPVLVARPWKRLS